jgi:hypothetical protein
MILVNFAHALTAGHLQIIEKLTGQTVTRVINVKTQFDEAQPFAEQARVLVNDIELTPEQWQTERLLINMPSYHYAAALLLAELHGRMGYFPSMLRQRAIEDSTPRQYEVAEILNLQIVRETARQMR